MDEDPADGPSVFVLKLLFCDMAPSRVAKAQLDGYRRVLRQRLDDYQTMLSEASSSPRLFPRLVLGRAIARTEATLAWVDAAAATLERQTGR